MVGQVVLFGNRPQFLSCQVLSCQFIERLLCDQLVKCRILELVLCQRSIGGLEYRL
jgi:hypothetical protein